MSGRRLTLATLAVAAVVASASPSFAQTAVAPERAALNARVFDRVWGEVKADYYDPGLHGVDWTAARDRFRPQALAAADEQALYGVLRQMMGLLDDDHAAVSAPASVRRREAMRQRRAVMGLTLYPEDDGAWRVEQVRAGSPAEEAGVGLGWRLERIDGRRWAPDLDLTEGRAVALEMLDDAGAPRAVSVLPREMDPAPVFSLNTSREGVAVIRIEAFEAGLGRWMARTLDALPPGTDVILDLRANPGGRLAEADAVLSCFLEPRRPWATRTGRTGRRVVMRTSGGCGDGPYPVELAVLVDKTSRSAAELTPAALQEARRAAVIGEQTAGAVLISQDRDLPDGGRMTLSLADFVTQGGVRLEKRGVTPDVLVPARTVEDRRAGRDPALETAVAMLRATP